MAENIFDLLNSDYPKLMDTLKHNEDVCTFLIGFYAQALYMAQGDNNNPEDLRCEVSIRNERLLIVKTFYVGSERSKVDVGNRLPRQRNLNLVKFLQVNKSVKDVALNVTYSLEAWMNDKPYRKKQGFKNILLRNGMRWKSGEFTAEIVLKFEFDEMVSAKMNWDMDEPEQPTEGSLIQ